LKAGIDLISRRAQDELFHIYQRKTGIPHQRDGSIRCKKKRAVKNRIENPILHSSGSFVYFSFRPSGRFFRFSF
jgi:hypothetical protein